MAEWVKELRTKYPLYINETTLLNLTR
jgi:hypothetical protein